jgi:hypothetical protein
MIPAAVSVVVELIGGLAWAGRRRAFLAPNVSPGPLLFQENAEISQLRQTLCRSRLI